MSGEIEAHLGEGAKAPITAIVTAWRRVDQTLLTISKIRSCCPAPAEILVHVDGGEDRCALAIRHAYPDIKILESKQSVGPGGGRNKLVQTAQYDLVASFDDDSYPVDNDYFSRAILLFKRFPDAALIAATIQHRGEPEPPLRRTAGVTGNFVGCGVVYRQAAFVEAGGYVPLPIAYGMEEEDLALRILDQGKTMLCSPWLRVFHDTDLSHHSSPQLTAAQIANTALLAFLRYPPRYWLYGAAQVANRALWSATHGRLRGVARGLGLIPSHLWGHRALRRPVLAAAVKTKRDIRTSLPNEFEF